MGRGEGWIRRVGYVDEGEIGDRFVVDGWMEREIWAG